MSDYYQPEIKVEPEVTQPTVPEEIEVGGVKYNQADLERYVGLGKIGAEAEDKFKTKIDRVWPEYTKATQKIQDLETKLAEREQARVQEKVTTKQELSPEEIKAVARQQARELGLLTDDDFQAKYTQVRTVEKLLEETKAVVADAEAKEKPKTSVEAILNHMQQTGIKNPEKAYKDLYESELDQWKEKQLGKVKPTGFTTISTSTAGSKEPKPIKWAGMKQDELMKLVSESLGS